MHQPQAFDAVWRTPAAQALALKLVTEADLLRLKVIARLHARGLPPEMDWSDLLQEAFARVLDGSRRQPDGLPMVIFLAGVMRSMKTEHWRRAREKARQLPKLLADLGATDAPGGEPRDPAPDPERSLIAIQELIAITQLFAEDAQARRVIAGLAEERSPAEIRASYDMSETDYDSTRKRMRRVLLREGLRVPPP
jgi:DNA-directed RNA polymerase specialized sigma24 family protein